MTEQATEIPGLIAITEETGADGKTSFIFEIEDGKEAEFYTAFGLQTGDTEGFQRVLIEAIEMLLARMRDRDAKEKA